MYAAQIDGQRLTFEVTAVWRKNMIMTDRETGGLWQHATGECLAGPLKGKQLPILGGQQLTWSAWHQMYPETTVIIGPEKWPGLLSKEIVETILQKATASGSLPGKSLIDRRLPQNEDVFGVESKGAWCAYRVNELKENGLILDQLGGEWIVLRYLPEGDLVQAYQLQPGDYKLEDGRLVTAAGKAIDPGGEQGRQIYGLRKWWNGWYEFHPGTRIYMGRMDTE